jgi:Putative sensor
MKMATGLLRFLRAPFELRTYTNLAYLLLAFPLGLGYFLFLALGLSLGFGLAVIWVGLPLLLLVLLGSWVFAAFERQLALGLLGAEIPPMSQPAREPRSVAGRLGDLLSNPVTWKGMGFLLLKFPLGVVSFVATTVLLSVSVALTLVPLLYYWQPADIYADFYEATPGQALLCGLVGLLLGWTSIQLLNGLAWLWKILATVTLGSERFAAPVAESSPPAPPPVPGEPALA